MSNLLAQRVLLAFVGLCSLICVVAFASSQVVYRPWGVPEGRRAEYEQKVERIRQRQALMEKPVEGPQPSVFLAEDEHDFGIVDPGTVNEHAFEIINLGEAPLALLASETSCKCTLSELENTIVAPGAATQVTLSWNAGGQREHYRQFALIETNDPEQPEISVAVTGTVREQLGFDPPQWVASRLQPDSLATLSTVVYSQLHDDFEIIDVRSNLEGFQYYVDPVLPETLEQMEAKAAQRLIVTLPAAEPGESLQDRILVTVQPRIQKAPAIEEEISLDLKVLPRIAFYGARLDVRYGLDLGVLTQGDTGQQKILVRVRGNMQETPLEVLEVEPACLRATLENYKPAEGLYRLTVGVAHDAPPVAFRAGNQIGYIAVGNAEQPQLQKGLPVRGQVIPPLSD